MHYRIAEKRLYALPTHPDNGKLNNRIPPRRKAYTMNQITVYTKPACVQCNAVFRALDNAGIEYRKVDISTDTEAREYVMALGYLFF
jgi:hypothetical protein